jgi:hypothetical protein
MFMTLRDRSKSLLLQGGGFPLLVFLLASDFWLPLHQGHMLFNPVEFHPVVGLTPDSWLHCFLQPGWEGCRLKQHQTAPRAEC